MASSIYVTKPVFADGSESAQPKLAVDADAPVRGFNLASGGGGAPVNLIRWGARSPEAYHLAFLGVIVMTQLLEKALSEVANLPPSEQDALAAILLEELASEQKWSELFAKSQDQLARLAKEALVEHRAGKTKPL